MNTIPVQYETFDACSPYDAAGPYRAADYWQLPEGESVELLRGRFMMSPSPIPLHQIVAGRLNRILQKAEIADGGLALLAPMDVVLADDTVVQPDLLYIAQDRRSIVQNCIEGPPDLIIEILSPTTERRDRLEKLDLYARYRVAEYWMVDPQKELFEFLINQQGRFVVMSSSGGRYQSPCLPRIEIDLASFWQEVKDRLG
jgi:Uma2 family endonuclease